MCPSRRAMSLQNVCLTSGKNREPPSPGKTLGSKFKVNDMEGVWYKVAGYNPNYDCYACQRNKFTKPPVAADSKNLYEGVLKVDVEFGMPRIVKDFDDESNEIESVPPRLSRNADHIFMSPSSKRSKSSGSSPEPKTVSNNEVSE